MVKTICSVLIVMFLVACGKGSDNSAVQAVEPVEVETFICSYKTTEIKKICAWTCNEQEVHEYSCVSSFKRACSVFENTSNGARLNRCGDDFDWSVIDQL